MRKTMLSLILAAAGVAGMASAMPASAQSGRIYVDIGDVSFAYGRPYWRYDRGEPLYVVYERGYPRYYRYDRGWRGDRYYSEPVVYLDYGRYDRRHRSDRYYRYDRYDHRDRRYYRDRDRRHRGW